MARSSRYSWRIDSHDAWTNYDQHQRSAQTGSQTTHRPGCIKPLPKKRKSDPGQICRSRHRKSERNQESDVGVFSKKNSKSDCYRSDHEGSDTGDVHFFSSSPFCAFVNNSRVEVMRERGRGADG